MRTWCVRAGYVAMGFPLLVLATMVRHDLAHPLAGMLVLPLLLAPIVKLRALARQSATDAPVIVVTLILIAVSAMVSLLLLLMTSPGHDPDYERVGKVVVIASIAMQMALGRPLIRPTKQQSPPA